MLTITTTEIISNNLDNLNIKGKSDLYNNFDNKIGVVKINLPNCKVQDDEIVIMGFDNRKKNITITKSFHFAEIDELKFGVYQQLK